jgi:hypothetical protein
MLKTENEKKEKQKKQKKNENRQNQKEEPRRKKKTKIRAKMGRGPLAPAYVRGLIRPVDGRKIGFSIRHATNPRASFGRPISRYC